MNEIDKRLKMKFKQILQSQIPRFTKENVDTKEFREMYYCKLSHLLRKGSDSHIDQSLYEDFSQKNQTFSGQKSVHYQKG